MNRFSTEELIEIFRDAKKLNLEDEFINKIKEELIKRNINIREKLQIK